MGSGFGAFADQLARRLAALSAKIEACILTEMISGGDTYCSYHFEVDAPTLRGLGEVFRADPVLWEQFQRVVYDYRPWLHWTKLLDHVYEVGNLEGKLKMLEQGLSCPAAQDRRRLAAYLNCIDAEVGLCRELADRRGLAGRISQAAGYPLMDGLSLRGLAYVLGEDADLWQEFQSFVGCPDGTVPGRPRLPDAQS
jgi:hypothetical protein